MTAKAENLGHWPSSTQDGKPERNDPVSALAIRLLVAAGHITQEKANEAFTIACQALEVEAERMGVELPWVGRTAPMLTREQADRIAGSIDDRDAGHVEIVAFIWSLAGLKPPEAS